MSEAHQDGGPLFFAAERPPSATAIDEDIYVTIATINPLSPGEVETVDIMLSPGAAAQLIAALNDAVSVAAKNAAASPLR